MEDAEVTEGNDQEAAEGTEAQPVTDDDLEDAPVDPTPEPEPEDE